MSVRIGFRFFQATLTALHAAYHLNWINPDEKESQSSEEQNDVKDQQDSTIVTNIKRASYYGLHTSAIAHIKLTTMTKENENLTQKGI